MNIKTKSGKSRFFNRGKEKYNLNINKIKPVFCSLFTLRFLYFQPDLLHVMHCAFLSLEMCSWYRLLFKINKCYNLEWRMCILMIREKS